MTRPTLIEKMPMETPDLREGLSPTSPIASIADAKINAIYRITDDGKGQSFLACLDDAQIPGTPKALGLRKNTISIRRDIALTDELAANLARQCRLKTI